MDYLFAKNADLGQPNLVVKLRQIWWIILPEQNGGGGVENVKKMKHFKKKHFEFSFQNSVLKQQWTKII